MRTTLALDDDLVAKAQACSGIKEKSALVREALKALIERESARSLARLGGTEPNLKGTAAEAGPTRNPSHLRPVAYRTLPKARALAGKRNDHA
ncbi:MAG TPA: type II toxin-antitoxin system VapB family antitoxin [Sphingomicrobium sp.]|nr:type II toxin-antitoxin system VapB family antitoxin [Sphingomicrobium sp.]